MESVALWNRALKSFQLAWWICGLICLACGARADDFDSPLPFGITALGEWIPGEHPVSTAMGRQALQIDPDSWQHLQGIHFVLHFINKGVAIRTSQEAEFYLGRIKQELRLDNSDTIHKTHIFIFEREDDWKNFTKSVAIDPWTGGFFDGLDLFYWRKTGLRVLNSDSTLPHEIAHRVLYEKYPQGKIPIALNEGFAEYHARKLAFRYLRPRGYDVRVISKRVPRDKFLSVEALLAAKHYPSNGDDVTAFYDESERLVNFLVEKHAQGTFSSLLDAMAQGQSFDDALLKICAGTYSTLDQFEHAFADYAILPETK